MHVKLILPRSIRIILTAATTAGSCLALACGGDSTDPGDGDPAVVASVAISPAHDTLEAGTTTQLQATVRDASGNVLTGRTESWTSDNESAATVDQSGVVTAVNNGVAHVQVTVEGVRASTEIAAYVGVTGQWDGSLLAGTAECPLTVSLTESLDGELTGTGLVGAPCTSGSYIIVGVNHAGGIADSVYMYWNGDVNLTLEGHFDGQDTMGGYLDGGGCGGVACPSSLARTTVVTLPQTLVNRAPVPLAEATHTGAYR